MSGAADRAENQIRHAARLAVPHLGDDTLVHAAASVAIEGGGIDQVDPDASHARIEHRPHAVVGPPADAQRAHASRPQRLDHRMQSEDQHDAPHRGVALASAPARRA